MSTGCREQCTRSGEPLAGSAGRTDTFVAISWPKRRWHPDKASRSDGLPPELAALEADAKASGRPLALRVFQRETGAASDALELLCYRRAGASFRAASVGLDALAGVVARAHAGEQPGVTSEPLGRELLVCTDGQHDDCCGRFGRPVYKALCDELSRRDSTLRVSESSHLGGHRFAANLLALPAGELYGRVEPGDAATLLTALDADQVLRYRFRGRLGADEASQVADAFLAARLSPGAEWQLAAAPEPDGEGRCRVAAEVRESGRSRALQVRCELRAFEGPSSCGAEPEARRRWVATALEERRS